MARLDPHLAIGGLAARELQAQQSAASPAGGASCPDAELLAAYVDDGLGDGERAELEDHLAICASCRQMVAVLVPADAPRAEPARVLRPVFRVDWKWLSMAAMVVLAVGLWYVIQTDVRLSSVRQDARSDIVLPPAAGPQPVDAAAAPGTRERVPAPTETYAVTQAPPNARAADARLKQDLEAMQKLEAKEGRRQTPAEQLEMSARSADLLARRVEAERLRQAASGPSQGQSPTASQVADEQKRMQQEVARVAQATPPPAAPPPPATQPAPVTAPAARPATPAPEPAPKVNERRDRAAEPARNAAVAAGPAAVGHTVPAFREMDTGVVFADPERRLMWRIAGGTRVESSIDGSTWTERYRERSGRLFAGTAPSIDVAWTAGARGLVLRYVVPGSWARVAKPSDEDLVSIAASSGNAAQVTTASGRRFETRDGGATWTPVP